MIISNKKKIFNFLKKKLREKAILIDVGAHHGETIKNFINNFRALEIHSFEASPENSKILNKKFKDQKIPKVIVNDYGLSNENKELDLVEKNLSDLLNIYKSNQILENFLKNPTQSFDNQLIIINKISNLMSFSKILKDFLSVLVIKRRIFFLEKIILSFLKLVAEKNGQLSAQLISSKKLSNEELKNVSNELSKAIGSEISFDFKVDESLIGGFKIQIGSLMVDTSIKNRLKKYEQIMLEN